MSRPRRTTIRTIAPNRSDQAARLKKSHQNTTSNAKDDSANHRGAALLGNDDGKAEHDQPLQDHGEHAGP